MAWALRQKRDTDWLDVSAFLANGWVADSIEIRRDGNTSVLRFVRLDGRAATSTYFLQNLPAGYFQGNANIPARISAEWHNVWAQAGGRNFSLPTATPISSTLVIATQYVGGLPRPAGG